MEIHPWHNPEEDVAKTVSEIYKFLETDEWSHFGSSKVSI